MIEASEHLIATDLKGAALVLRAAASYSVAIKNTSDTLRHSFEIGKATDDLEDMPELTIKVITDTQAAEMQMSGIVKDDEEEDETVELMEED
jgi:hypothetical protein